MDSASSYDSIPDFGLLYDHVPLYQAREDVGFYVDQAKTARGPVLELGCGTGRILLPIARAGCVITGIDPSPAMLERCRTNLSHEPKAVQARITLEQQSLLDLDLGKSFNLAIAPFRVFQHLTTLENQLQALANIHRHLAPGGRLVFDVFNPKFSMLLGADGGEREEGTEVMLPDGRSFHRTYRIARVHWIEQTSDSELIYYVTPRPGAAPQRYVQAFPMRWYLRAELEHLVTRAGFRLRAIYGDFKLGPLVDGAPEQVVVAERL